MSGRKSYVIGGNKAAEQYGQIRGINPLALVSNYKFSFCVSIHFLQK